VSDDVGPRSSRAQSETPGFTDFDWPSGWHQGDDDNGTGWATSGPKNSDDAGSSPPLNEPGKDHASKASESPPPVIEAFPDPEYPQEPSPQTDVDSRSLPWPVTVAAIAAAVLVVVLVVIIVVIVASTPKDPTPTAAPSYTTSTVASQPPAPAPITVTSSLTVTVTTPPPFTTTTTTAAAAPDPEAASLQQLQAWADADRSGVYQGATHPDQWVPQLGSKKLGTRDNGVTYDYSIILQDFLQLKNRYSGAKPQLLRSGDWSTFGESDYWVTIADVTFSNSDGALQWCRGEGLDNNHCYAKLISTTHSVDGSTAYN
jgi:serine/threonine kinase PknH